MSAPSSLRTPRGFSYRLEALRAKVHHSADGSRLALAQRQSELRQASVHLEAIVQECAVLSAHSRLNAGGPVDVGWALHMAGAAVAKERLRVQALSAVHRAERAVEQARAELAAVLSRLEALDQHRDSCLREYAVGQARREAREADHDWLSRLAVHQENT
jgi:hypothetical protein